MRYFDVISQCSITYITINQILKDGEKIGVINKNEGGDEEEDADKNETGDKEKEAKKSEAGGEAGEEEEEPDLDADSFIIKFPADLPLDQKVTLLAGLFLVVRNCHHSKCIFINNCRTTYSFACHHLR
jgi:hypothetical protein